MTQLRKLTKPERELLCGCWICADGQMWNVCQYPKGDLLTPELKERLKELKKKK